MIQISELLSADAMRRYDDNGEPAYTTFERVLLCLRWFDWASTERVMDAMNLDMADDFERARYRNALRHYVKSGKIEQRQHLGLYEYRILPAAKQTPIVACRRCSRNAKIGSVLCPRHIEWQRNNKRGKRTAGRVHLCRECGQQGHNTRACEQRLGEGVAA